MRWDSRTGSVCGSDQADADAAGQHSTAPSCFEKMRSCINRVFAYASRGII
jgi:hypothetical protein